MLTNLPTAFNLSLTCTYIFHFDVWQSIASTPLSGVEICRSLLTSCPEPDNPWWDLVCIFIFSPSPQTSTTSPGLHCCKAMYCRNSCTQKQTMICCTLIFCITLPWNVFVRWRKPVVDRWYMCGSHGLSAKARKTKIWKSDPNELLWLLVERNLHWDALNQIALWRKSACHTLPSHPHSHTHPSQPGSHSAVQPLQPQWSLTRAASTSLRRDDSMNTRFQPQEI